MIVHTPTTEAEACDLVRAAADARRALSITGGGTRAGLGRPVAAQATLSAAGLSGITLYEPAEMVVSARAGTPLALIEQTLAARGQMLPFEPMDHRSLLGTRGEPTIGAVAAGNVSGPRRINAGAARDSLIGIRLVNGRGEAVKSGGRVMKNVTGLDLVKLVAGSYGTLGLLTEVTFRVLPRPERVVTLAWPGLADAAAVTLLSAALGSPYEPMAAAHLPAGIAGETALTLLRLENVSASIDYRGAELARLLKPHGRPRLIEGPEGDALWRGLRDAQAFAGTPEAVWRLSLAPSRGPGATAAIAAAIPAARWFYDWGGGLVWLAVPAEGDAGAQAIRAALGPLGGHATLVRAPEAVRAAVPVFEPLAEPLMRVSAGVKASFDPQGIFEPGRIYAGI
ncbi:FAD-binding protein [Bosea sp. TWI1241]|uniref:FAD-binding protein n=1 Tax=Bosea sp. TWI1241 TaxID=3148904 RepID=UPI00320A3F0C